MYEHELVRPLFVAYNEVQRNMYVMQNNVNNGKNILNHKKFCENGKTGNGVHGSQY